MKKYLFALAALSLIFACTPENNNNGGGSQNNPEELTITGDALDVTDCSATLTGYANLPFELGDAEVGIMYDKVKSFEAAKKVVATVTTGGPFVQFQNNRTARAFWPSRLADCECDQY